jgi:hypothetical protein
MNYAVANKTGQTNPKFTRQEHDAMKSALNSKQDATQVLWYNTIGDESNTLNFDGIEISPSLIGMDILSVNKENVELRPVTTFPASSREFSWTKSAGQITLKDDVNADEWVRIIYYNSASVVVGP